MRAQKTSVRTVKNAFTGAILQSTRSNEKRWTITKAVCALKPWVHLPKAESVLFPSEATIHFGWKHKERQMRYIILSSPDFEQGPGNPVDQERAVTFFSEVRLLFGIQAGQTGFAGRFRSGENFKKIYD